MENRRLLGFAQDRRLARSTSGGGWLNHHSPLAFGEEFVRTDKPVGVELLSVANATMTWWEKHKDDTMIEDGRKILRYQCKPSFVSHAQEILKRAVGAVDNG